MANTALLVDRALRAAGIPIDGVSIGDPADRGTWVVFFQSQATAPQRATAATLLTTVVVDVAAQNALQFADTSRQKDILAMVALVVRAKGLAAWNAMTVPQKVAATLAEADVWATIRDFVETNT